jgi:hypothetical protein
MIAGRSVAPDCHAAFVLPRLAEFRQRLVVLTPEMSRGLTLGAMGAGLCRTSHRAGWDGRAWVTTCTGTARDISRFRRFCGLLDGNGGDVNLRRFFARGPLVGLGQRDWNAF